jgi:hypothetical protein
MARRHVFEGFLLKIDLPMVAQLGESYRAYGVNRLESSWKVLGMGATTSCRRIGVMVFALADQYGQAAPGFTMDHPWREARRSSSVR